MILRFYGRRITAGFCLAFFFFGCGVPQYRLEGNVSEQVGEVALLDGQAEAVLDSIRASYFAELKALDEGRVAALDSLSKGSSALNRPIATARKRYNEARARYRDVFGRLRRFQSFGGNPVFSDQDASMSTKNLLSEISDRFYKGRAFSLETEGQIRRYIRQNLVPLERDMNLKRNKLRQLQRSHSGKAKGRDQLEKMFGEMRVALRDSANASILSALATREIVHSQVDSSGKYNFSSLAPAQYHLYVPHPLPSGHLVPVKVQTHLYQHLGPENARVLLLPTDAS